MEHNQYFTKYPVLQVRTWGLLVYERTEWHYTGNKDKTKKPKPEHKLYSGQITEYSKRRLKRAIQLLVASALEKEAPNFKTGKNYKFKVNFITLTLPAPQEEITDKQIKKECLDPFIKRLKRKHQLGSYVWRAERQKNNNIHFHIITDSWIHYEKIRNDWNDCINKFGFVTKYKQKHSSLTLAEYLYLYPPTKTISRASRVKSYERGQATKWEQPNSTDVHAVWKVKNLTQYFIKYMTKGEGESDLILGKVWDCSINLKTKQNCEFLLEEEASQQWNECYNDDRFEKKIDPLYSMIFMNERQMNKYLKDGIRDKWNEYLTMIRSQSREFQPHQKSALAELV
jgi:hypothetical protein